MTTAIMHTLAALSWLSMLVSVLCYRRRCEAQTRQIEALNQRVDETEAELELLEAEERHRRRILEEFGLVDEPADDSAVEGYQEFAREPVQGFPTHVALHTGDRATIEGLKP